MVRFYHLPGEWNPADILSKHWGYFQIWEKLQAVLFWRGDTADLLVKADPSLRGKGSDKLLPLTSEAASP
jgi:hypothetical protein